jgi:hypothetical protein
VPLAELRLLLCERGDRITRITRDAQQILYPNGDANLYARRGDIAYTEAGHSYIASEEGWTLVNGENPPYWQRKIIWSRWT